MSDMLFLFSTYYFWYATCQFVEKLIYYDLPIAFNIINLTKKKLIQIRLYIYSHFTDPAIKEKRSNDQTVDTHPTFFMIKNR